MIKLIVFDLDGTLLDTIYDLHEAMNYVLKKYNYRLITLDMAKQNIGTGIRNFIKKSINDESNNNIDNMFNDFMDYYSKNYNNKTKLYDGIYDIVYNLKKDGYILGVISNKRYEILNNLVNDYFKDLFSFVIGDGSGFKKKPDNESILYIINRYNINKEELLYIGDSDTDIITINNSGCMGLIVSYGYRKYEELIKYNIKNISKNTTELKENIYNVLNNR